MLTSGPWHRGLVTPDQPCLKLMGLNKSFLSASKSTKNRHPSSFTGISATQNAQDLRLKI